MPAELFRVKLLRDNVNDPWGFKITGGGEQLLVISEVITNFQFTHLKKPQYKIWHSIFKDEII